MHMHGMPSLSVIVNRVRCACLHVYMCTCVHVHVHGYEYAPRMYIHAYTHKSPLSIVPHDRLLPSFQKTHPGAWALPEPLFMTSFCPPDPRRALYTIGRTMFETDRLSEHHVQRCNMMSEIWVPTAFHRDVFVHSGVAPGKVHVVGEAVDVEHFDPGRVAAGGLKSAIRVFGPPRDNGVQYYRFLSVCGERGAGDGWGAWAS